ncbi:hypothetical protein NIES4102_33350 [Chondrocystis sp. NIES-4102]|nr:hypothetical protein NIES4102_33350 [Chondrocystis sp. NIES-4102]
MNIRELYNQDFNLWVEEIKQKIQKQDFREMDWENLLEEIDDMGKSEKRSLESYLQRLIEHILKLKYWESQRERNYRHWRAEVANFRNQINRLLKRNPSFQKYLEEIYPEIFAEVIQVRRLEFDIPDDVFIALEEIMTMDYFG